MFVELVLTVTVALAAYLYILIKSKYRFFKDKGLQSPPVVPIFGNIMKMVLKLRHMLYVYDDIYKAFPNERIIGYFEFFNPLYMIRDPELIKQITVKDFDHFVDHRSFFTSESDQIFSNSLFSMQGDRWRDMRSTISPAFTGSKMRNMCPFMVECGHQVVDYLKKEIVKESSNQGSTSLEIEMKDLYTRFATDVIANSAFGCKTDSLVDRQNDFFITGKKMTTLSTLQLLRTLIIINMPKLASILKLRIFDVKILKYFQNICMNTIEYRQRNNIVRPDIINIFMEVKKGSLKYESQTASDDAGFATVEESEIGKTQSKRVWSDDELISQAFLFFFAGYESISTALSFTTIELAAHPEVQKRLRNEVDANYPENGNVTYELIQKLTYLDMVVSESLRLWAPAPPMDRLCVKTYNVPDKDGNKTDIVIEKGKVCVIPGRAIHHDPLYWDDPEKFDPERFSYENKHKIQSYTYMPFGLGPRNCIGSRFALMEVKVILFYLIRNFSLASCSRTMNPMVLPKHTMTMALTEGFWIKMTPRDTKLIT